MGTFCLVLGCQTFLGKINTLFWMASLNAVFVLYIKQDQKSNRYDTDGKMAYRSLTDFHSQNLEMLSNLKICITYYTTASICVIRTQIQTFQPYIFMTK